MNKTMIAAIGIGILLLALGATAYVLRQDMKKDASSTTSETENNSTSGDDSDTQNPEEPQVSGSYTSPNGVIALINTPAYDAEVSSPLEVSGSVPGSWSFEGQFTVRLVSLKGDALAEESVKLDGDWMTDELVPFSTALTFTAPSEKSGSLILVKANPSDLPENSDTITIPVRF